MRNANSKVRPAFVSAQRGSGLIEVLVAVFVMSLGLYAAANLHATIIRSGTTALNRSAATSIAQDLMDRMRSFDAIDVNCSTDAYSTELSSFPDFDCYSEIPVVSTALLDGTLTRNGQLFAVQLSGEVKQDGTNWNLYKAVSVTVSWTDLNGAGQVELISGIYPYALGASVLGEGGSYACTDENYCNGPKVNYVPTGTPDAVPITITLGNLRETSKPIPTVSRQGDSTLVQFSSTSYTSENIAVSNEEYITVSCVCEFNSIGLGMTPTRMVWNPETKKLEHELGVKVQKVIGRVPLTGPSASQPLACNTCCRDHHDVDGSEYPKYAPEQNLAEPDSDTHLHYWPNSSGVLEDQTAGAYLEACRLKRIDGFFYVMQDWLLRDIVVMPKDDYLSVSTSLTSYQNYLYSNLESFGLGGNSSASKTTLANRNFVDLVSGQQAQLLARGLYVDKIYQCRPGATSLEGRRICPEENDPTQIDSQYLADLAEIKAESDTNDNTDWLGQVPFNELNLTLLAGWKSNAEKTVTVANDPVTDISDPVTGYYTSYYRGRVTGYSGSDVVTGSADITASVRRGNTGVTSGVMSRVGAPLGYNRYPGENDDALSDFIQVTRLADGDTYGISGNFVLRFSAQAFKPKPNTWGATASPSSGVTCTSTGNANGPGYSCTVPSGWSGTITPFAVAGGPGNDPASTVYYFNPTSRSYSNVTAEFTGQNFDFCREQTLCQ